MKKTVDDIFAMSESRYALVNLIADKARELAEDAEKRKEPMEQKPVNVVVNNLLTGKSVIVKQSPVVANSAFSVLEGIDFDAPADDAQTDAE
ncbi:MAG: DNA-directed RNA polymerase subunit omega [Clostridia bacterium]|nr:DNA-directed RNA polymerase subunit omega [Clostridia bacterium]